VYILLFIPSVTIMEANGVLDSVEELKVKLNAAISKNKVVCTYYGCN